MALQGLGDISRLSNELLAQILRKLNTAEVMQSCAVVSTTFNKAAALSTSTISIPECSRTKATALSDWLQAHGAAAPINNITVISTGSSQHQRQLLLPVQHLTQLQSLQLKGSSLSALRAGGQGPVLDSVHLSALTSLALDRCHIKLEGLVQLTGLQELHISVNKPPADADASIAPIFVADAVSRLLKLTSLQLGGPASQDAALVHLSCLTALQQLKLTDAQCTSASFLQLPSSLTMVSIRRSREHSNQHALEMSSSSTPGMCQLTALQDLSVVGVAGDDSCKFHVEMLSSLTALTKIDVVGCQVMAGPGPRLVVLTGLTRLQHLQMHVWSLTHPPAVTVEDFSALTSSQQLTRIDLAYRVAPNHSAGVFQGQRQLSNLHFLSLGISWVADLEAMERMVTCCPNLRRLKIDSYGATEDGDDVAGIDPSFWEEGFASLTRLSALTKLALLSIDVSMQPEVFAAIAGLTGLRELTCEYLDATELGSMMQLTTLRQLTKFTVDALQLGHPLGDDHERRLELCVQNKAPEGAPPDVWQQIPAVILDSAADHFEWVMKIPKSLHSLLRAAAFASKGAAERLSDHEQRLQGLEQRVMRMEDSTANWAAAAAAPGRMAPRPAAAGRL